MCRGTTGQPTYPSRPRAYLSPTIHNISSPDRESSVMSGGLRERITVAQGYVALPSPRSRCGFLFIADRARLGLLREVAPDRITSRLVPPAINRPASGSAGYSQGGYPNINHKPAPLSIVGLRLAFARFWCSLRATIMIAAAAHCPWDKVWSNLGLARATLLLLSLLLTVATGNVWHSSRPAWLITFSC